LALGAKGRAQILDKADRVVGRWQRSTYLNEEKDKAEEAVERFGK
jgi:hypothetical protein